MSEQSEVQQTDPVTALTDAIDTHLDDDNQPGAPVGRVVEEMLSDSTIDLGDVSHALKEGYFHGVVYQPSPSTVARVATDGGTAAEKVLDDNGVGQDNDYETKAYGGSEAAIEAIETYVSEHVTDERIASSGSISNTAPDVRTQEIGKTLGSHLRGDTPDDFLVEVDVSKWRDTSPVKWVFKRRTGEASTRESRTLQQPELVREISAATDANGARYKMAERGGACWEVTNTTVEWMRDVLAAVCETVGYRPKAVQDDEELDRREWIDQLTQAGTTDVLERVLDIDAPGNRDDWNNETLRAIYDVVVSGRDPREVGR